MRNPLLGPLRDARAQLLGIAGVVAMWGALERLKPRPLAEERHWDQAAPPLIVDEGHDPATCQWCRELGPAWHAARPPADPDGGAIGACRAR